MATEKLTPVTFTWDGAVMAPLHADRCEQYTVGDRYVLVPYDQRSRLSHDHFFCCVRAAFQNWPENYPIALASEDQLRKHALIRTGHYDQFEGVYPSPEQAAAFVSMMMQQVEYAEYSVFDNAVVIRIAKTQKKKEMGAALFQRSKQDCLDFFSAILDVDVTTLVAEAKRQAA